jgi:hypothetical protein
VKGARNKLKKGVNPFIPLTFPLEPDFSGACSSVWLERTPDKREVGGSTPPRPTRRAKLARGKVKGAGHKFKKDKTY